MNLELTKLEMNHMVNLLKSVKVDPTTDGAIEYVRTHKSIHDKILELLRKEADPNN